MKYDIAVGTYTDGSDSRGIYLYTLQADGRAKLDDVAGESSNPSYLAYCAKTGCLYAANERSDGSALCAYRLDGERDKLTHLNTLPLAGAGMCHVSVSRDGRFALAAHYLSGSAVSVSLGRDGSIARLQSDHQHHGKGPNELRQEHEHVHSLTFSPDERFVYAADLGTDELKCYRPGPDGVLTPCPDLDVHTAPGEGPRHLAFHPSGRWAYLVTELKNHVIVYDFDAASGALCEKQKLSTLPPDYQGENLAADLAISRDGRFLYASNRGYNSIACYQIDEKDGTLTIGQHSSCYGDWPRSICLAGEDRFLLIANQQSDEVAVCARDAASGALIAPLCRLAIPQAVCVKEICLPD